MLSAPSLILYFYLYLMFQFIELAFSKSIQIVSWVLVQSSVETLRTFCLFIPQIIYHTQVILISISWYLLLYLRKGMQHYRIPNLFTVFTLIKGSYRVAGNCKKIANFCCWNHLHDPFKTKWLYHHDLLEKTSVAQ